MAERATVPQSVDQNDADISGWSELDSLIDGVADPEYIAKLHGARSLDESFIAEFSSVLEAAGSEEANSKQAEASAIKSFFGEKLQAGETLTRQQMATVLYELKNRGDDAGVVDVFEAGVPSGLDESAVLKEFYAVSLNKVGRLEDSIKTLEDLMGDDNARIGEVAGILGKVRKLQSKEAIDEQQKAEFMRQSVDALRDGFYATYEFYPGVNLVYNQIELAKLTGDSSLIEKAFNDAELVMYSAKKAGAERTADFWIAATLLESSIFAGEVTPQMIQHCLDTSQHDWELGATIGNLKNVAETITTQLESGDLDEDTAARLSNILATINGNNEDVGVMAVLEGRESLAVEKESHPNDAILENGFMYGETTTLIGGNIAFGGQLQDHVVNRFDAKVAYSVIEHFELDALRTIEDFNSAVDAIIRQQFGTAELEDLHGDAHKGYDTQMVKVVSALGVGGDLDKSVADTRTNVMVDFLLGKGDCRQHAHAKQLLFDSWKTFKLNNLIGKLKDAHETPDATDNEQARRQIQELLSKQMLVFDSRVMSMVQMDSFYHPTQDEAGNLIVSDDYEPVEDHSWNGLVTLDENDHVVSLEMADSFYQDVYGFGGRGQIITELGSYSEEGLIVTTQVAVDKTGVLVEVPVKLTPLVYSGDREKRHEDDHADVGAAHLRGVDLGFDVPQVAEVFSSLKITELWNRMAQ